MNSSKEKLVLIDGNAILHRAYHAFPQTLRVSTTGELTNAVYGFAVTLLNVVAKLRPTHIVVAFDVKGKTFRHKEFDGYKASRPKMDEELASQIDRVRELVDILGIPQFGVEGFEADDVIGTIAYQAREQMPVYIVTGDRDALQLIDDRTSVYFPSRGRKFPEKIFDGQSFVTEWKFKPEQLVDYKALAGDNSDEIPGVSGIGPKTATELVATYGTVENIYQHLNEIKESVREKLVRDHEQALLSKRLATIVKDAPVSFDAKASLLHEYDKDKAEEFFLNMEFKSLISRLPSRDWSEIESLFGQKPDVVKEKKVKPEDVVAEGQMGMF